MNYREDELRRALESKKKPPQPQKVRRRKGEFGTRMNWGFWILIVIFVWFIIDWFIWGPGRIGG